MHENRQMIQKKKQASRGTDTTPLRRVKAERGFASYIVKASIDDLLKLKGTDVEGKSDLGTEALTFRVGQLAYHHAALAGGRAPSLGSFHVHLPHPPAAERRATTGEEGASETARTDAKGFRVLWLDRG